MDISSSSSSNDGFNTPSTELAPAPTYPLPPEASLSAVLAEDVKTPDKHVPRDSRLIRLTGLHPFNAEAPLSKLYDEGSLTTDNLHYVRNHGAVPRCHDRDVDSWTFSIRGLVAHPLTLSLRDLYSYDQVTYPVTLVCAGNRRKEQNTVRKSKGFSWGSAGLSTALWTGIAIGQLLARAEPLKGARYIWCMDASKGILVAYKMNGLALSPDHGKPVRLIVPGQIGGRSVKWLKKIMVTAEPSDNWYHIYDNRVLPTSISPEASADPSNSYIWKDERHAIYDLNVNSAICHPAHDESIVTSSLLDTYQVRGYAYCGGGRRISRVEVTLDQGRTWKLADVDYPEDQYREAAADEELFGGKLDVWWRETCFCWCFWSVDVPVTELAASKDVMVRAMDDGLMVQQRDMYWNVLGMMNNNWFRVVLHRERGGSLLRFEHPTQPALNPGGWMERVKGMGGDLLNGFWGQDLAGLQDGQGFAEENEEDISMVNSEVDRVISIEELEAHGNESSPWFVVQGQVYDGTPFLDDHPGGAASITGVAAQDASDEFLAIHLSHDVKIFRFKLQHQNQQLGLPVGQHVLLRLASSSTLIRAYTPISPVSTRGSVDVLVKIYRPWADQKRATMTQTLDSIPLGSPVDFKGPLGKFEYRGRGVCIVAGATIHVRRLYMMCAGSGITPIFQVLQAISKDEHDQTECVVLYGNRTEEDVLCRRELDDIFGGGRRGRLRLTLTRPSASWTGRKGRIDEAMLEKDVGPCDETAADHLALVCGPRMLEANVRRVLLRMGWRDRDVVLF
ncbi:Nitrate reductase [Ophiocordyceps camponoti-floridani]|uniref:Nitrate reductase [NADPH] n=1 Tax=Ophiocordyceps camponoti-floridani TaxID=2030778 RepID=A0A8H4QCJ7_9HYPO|nr:Nitrate reductase [Ophiocordyceps camponoti-floridani]